MQKYHYWSSYSDIVLFYEEKTVAGFLFEFIVSFLVNFLCKDYKLSSFSFSLLSLSSSICWFEEESSKFTLSSEFI